jgi:hypothetical protein
MGRQASDKTLYTTERRTNKRLMAEMAALRAQLEGYRFRATRAEQEAAEWKRRFDELLKLRVDVEALPAQRSDDR